MKYNVMGLLRNAALQLTEPDGTSEGGYAYALMELANNLRSLMRGEHTIEEFKTAYTGHEGEPLDIDKLLPTTDET